MADNDLWRSKATTVSSLRRPSTAALAHRQYSTQEAMLNSRVETSTTPCWRCCTWQKWETYGGFLRRGNSQHTWAQHRARAAVEGSAMGHISIGRADTWRVACSPKRYCIW